MNYMTTYSPRAGGIRRLALDAGIIEENTIDPRIQIPMQASRYIPRSFWGLIPWSGVENTSYVFTPEDTVLNLGNRTSFTARGARVINPVSVVRNVVDKRSCNYIVRKAIEDCAGTLNLELLNEINSVAELREAMEETGGSYIARTTSTGSRGQGVSRLMGPDDINYSSNYRYFTRYLGNTRREFRVMVIGGHYHIFHRVHVGLANGQVSPNKDLVQAASTGWQYQHYTAGCSNGYDANVQVELIRGAQVAASALALEYGAIDIVRTRTGRNIFMEANSAPLYSQLVSDVCRNSVARMMVGD